MDHPTIYTNSEKKLIFALMLSSILPLIDASIINVLLISISKDISASITQMQWAITSYMLACSGGILLSSVISKTQGLKNAWVYAMLIFLSGSVLVGLSLNMVSLIASRCLQGLGAGVLLPLGQSALAIQFGKQRLKSVMALIAIPAVFAPALGPLLGAILTESLNWRLAFFINAPLVIISMIVGTKFFPKTEKISLSVNIPLFLLFFSSLILIPLSINNIISVNGESYCYFVLLLSGILILIVSIIFNNKSTNHLLNLSQFKKIEYSSSLVMGLLTSFIFYSFLIYFPLIKSIEGGYSTIYIGILLGLQGIGAWLARRIIYYNLKYYNSFLVISISIFVSAFSIIIIQKEGTFLECIGFIIRGSGLGIATISVLAAPFEYSEKEYIHDTSAITRIIQQLGGVFGGLLAGFLIIYVTHSYININSSYQLLFYISIFIGIVSLLMYIALNNRAMNIMSSNSSEEEK